MDGITLCVDVSMATVALMVQYLLYPGFKMVGPERFPAYHEWYTRRITWFVGPLMAGQVVLHAYFVVDDPSNVLNGMAALGVVLTWVITGVKAVPLHARLGRDGFDVTSVDALIRTNWTRSIIWIGIALMWIWR